MYQPEHVDETRPGYAGTAWNKLMRQKNISEWSRGERWHSKRSWHWKHHFLMIHIFIWIVFLISSFLSFSFLFFFALSFLKNSLPLFFLYPLQYSQFIISKMLHISWIDQHEMWMAKYCTHIHYDKNMSCVWNKS